MIKALFWLLVILCLISFVYGLGSLLKRKSDGEDIKTDTIMSFIFAGLTFVVSLVILFGEDEIKGGPPVDTTTPVVSISHTDQSVPFSTTTTAPSTNPPPPSTTLSSSKGNIHLQGNTITGTINSDETVLIQSYKAGKSGRYRFDFYISDVTNKYRVIIKDSNNKEIASEYSAASGDSGITCNLNAEEEYQIIVKVFQYKSRFTFDIKINIPDN